MVQVRSGTSQVGTETAVSPVGIKSSERWNEEGGASADFNRDRSRARRDERLVIGILSVHDICLHRLRDADRTGVEDIVVRFEGVVRLQRFNGQLVGPTGIPA